MSRFIIALLVAIGVGGWVYAKIQRRTGGITQTSLMMAVAAGFIAFLFIFILFGFVPA